jgi:hypothetical protein
MEDLWILEGNTGYTLMHNFIQEMIPGEKISEDALISLGMTGTYRPKPGWGSGKENAVKNAAGFLLSGFSSTRVGGNPRFSILSNNGDGTFTRKKEN